MEPPIAINIPSPIVISDIGFNDWSSNKVTIEMEQTPKSDNILKTVRLDPSTQFSINSEIYNTRKIQHALRKEKRIQEAKYMRIQRIIYNVLIAANLAFIDGLMTYLLLNSKFIMNSNDKNLSEGFVGSAKLQENVNSNHNSS